MPEEIIYCINHPKTPTNLHCNKCGNPICSKCAVRTPVGYRCKDCVRNQQAVFYSSTRLDYVVAALIGLVGGLVGAVIAGGVGIFFSIFLSPLMGGLIAETVRLAVSKRRGRYTWLVVGLSIVAATLSVGLLPLLALLVAATSGGGIEVASSGLYNLLGLLIYVVLAFGTAAARLR